MAVVWLMSVVVLSPLTSTWVEPDNFLVPAGQFGDANTAVPYVNYRAMGEF